MKKDQVSKNVVWRMPRYLRKLDELADAGVERVSSTELGRRTGLTPSQIRQDLSCFGEFGQQGYGYNVASLRAALARILGMEQNHTAILVGAGRIGQTLLEGFDFVRRGFQLLSAFDVRPELMGTSVGGVFVRDAAEKSGFIREHGVDVAILAVTRSAAQRVADEVIAAGVRAIWNFTETDIDLRGSDVVIGSVHFSDSLLSLSYHLSKKETDGESLKK